MVGDRDSCSRPGRGWIPLDGKRKGSCHGLRVPGSGELCDLETSGRVVLAARIRARKGHGVSDHRWQGGRSLKPDTLVRPGEGRDHSSRWAAHSCRGLLFEQSLFPTSHAVLDLQGGYDRSLCGGRPAFSRRHPRIPAVSFPGLLQRGCEERRSQRRWGHSAVEPPG